MDTQEQPLTVEQIRARLDEIAPYKPDGPVTAVGLARQQAVEAQIAWARLLDPTQEITKKDIAIAQGAFGVAHALFALAEADPATAGKIATEIRDAWEDGGSMGEWIYAHHGQGAGEIALLADQMAVLYAAGQGTMYHESVAALRRSYAEAAAAFEKTSTKRFGSAHAEGAPRVEWEAYAGNLMAANFAYTLAAVLGEAAKFGPEAQQHLANLADNLITNGDDEDRNADVMPAEKQADSSVAPADTEPGGTS